MKLRKRDRRTEEVRCVLCHDHIPAGGVTCPTCQVRFHRACHEGRSGCPTYGCEGQLEDLVLAPASSIQGVRNLIGAGVLLVVGGVVVSVVLSIASMFSERAEEDRVREAQQRRQAAETQAAANERAAELRRREVTEQNRAQALALEAAEARREAEQKANQRELERRQREDHEGQAELAQRRAVIEAEQQRQQDRRKEAERLRAVETSAAEHVRTTVCRELAMHGSVPTERPVERETFDRLRAGEWARAVIAGSTALPDGLVEVHVEAPGLFSIATVVVRGSLEAGWTVVEVRL